MFELRPFHSNRGMTAYDPFREMENLERAFFGDRGFFSGGALSEFRTDIQDKGDSFLLEADLPGFKKEDIHIDLDGDTMTIRAERHSEHEDKDKQGNYLSCERSYGKYERSFDVSAVDAEGITAKYENGVLTVELPKKPEVLPAAKTIPIQ